MRISERLADQGEAVTYIVRSLAPRLRNARRASAELDAGRTPKQVADGLSMHPYAAKMLVSRVKGRSPEELRGAVTALADLEVWCRGGADYGDELGFVLALRRAAAAAA
jgi:DNA polymerase III delta subunit